MDSPKDLYSQQKAPFPSPLIFTIRPYRPEDKVTDSLIIFYASCRVCVSLQSLVYQVCLETGDNGGDGTKLFPNYPDLLGDRLVLPFNLYLLNCLHKSSFTL